LLTASFTLGFFFLAHMGTLFSNKVDG
jgi:hypothetical protein